MINRLLINMKNKISIIDGSIEQCEKLMNNETIELKGLHNLTITRGKCSNDWFIKRINELREEKYNLSVKVNRMV